MRRYTISPDVQLGEDVNKRIHEKKGDVYFPTLDDMECEIEDLDKEHYFEDISDEYAEVIKEKMEEMIERNPTAWVLENIWGKHTVKVVDMDIVICSGTVATKIFSAVELYGYSMENVDMAMNRAAIISAAIYEAHKQMYMELDEEISYQHMTKEGRVFHTQMTAHGRGDMTVTREEVTGYDAISPFGKKTLFYPKLESKTANIMGQHSTESRFMAALFAYAKELGVSNESIKSFCAELISELNSGVQYRKTNDENSLIKECLLLATVPMCKFHSKNPHERFARHSVAAEGGSRSYGLYFGAKKELIVTDEGEGKAPGKENIIMEIYPDELMPLIRSLVNHVAHGRSIAYSSTMESILRGVSTYAQ